MILPTYLRQKLKSAIQSVKELDAELNAFNTQISNAQIIKRTEQNDWIGVLDTNLDFKKLNAKIYEFKKYSKQCPYLIMNIDTLREMSACTNEDTSNYVVIELDCESGGQKASYTYEREDDTCKKFQTCTIIVDNDLAFGVVKVR